MPIGGASALANNLATGVDCHPLTYYEAVLIKLDVVACVSYPIRLGSMVTISFSSSIKWIGRWVDPERLASSTHRTALRCWERATWADKR